MALNSESSVCAYISTLNRYGFVQGMQMILCTFMMNLAALFRFSLFYGSFILSHLCIHHISSFLFYLNLLRYNYVGLTSETA